MEGRGGGGSKMKVVEDEERMKGKQGKKGKGGEEWSGLDHRRTLLPLVLLFLVPFWDSLVCFWYRFSRLTNES